MPEPIILASTSPYKKALFSRLRLPFRDCQPPFNECFDESLPPETLVRQNTLGKLQSVARDHPHAEIIASDQVAFCKGRVLGKPGNLQRAIDQLTFLSGKTATFLTGVAYCRKGEIQYALIPFEVRFRSLTEADIKAYLEIERPFDCAGAFKSEGLGISLFASMHGEDPTALQGLPLIQICEWLKPLRRLGRN